jgi:hypothetical protein
VHNKCWFSFSYREYQCIIWYHFCKNKCEFLLVIERVSMHKSGITISSYFMKWLAVLCRHKFCLSFTEDLWLLEQSNICIDILYILLTKRKSHLFCRSDARFMHDSLFLLYIHVISLYLSLIVTLRNPSLYLSLKYLSLGICSFMWSVALLFSV